MEEAATLDQDMLQQVIIPTLNVPRTVNGVVDEHEVVNQSQVYVTSAGYKSTFAYDKLMETVCQSVAMPKDAFVLGGDFRVPVLFGAFSKNFLRDLRSDGTFNEATFDREYGSKWSGNVESAFFDSQLFDKHRVNKLPELSPNGRSNAKTYYILGVDVGRNKCTTEICVIKVTPAPTGVPLKQLVNMYSIEAENFVAQTLKVKKIFEQYKCKCAVVDGNGMGVGFTDLLANETIDPDTGDVYPAWGVYNDDDGRYKKIKADSKIHDAMYVMIANASLNSDMYAYCQDQLQRGKLKFLVDENVAKTDRMDQTQWKKKRPEDRAEELMPYVMTTALKEQMVNMVEPDVSKNTSNIVLKPINPRIKHDRFSSFIYALYYCKLQEDKRGRRRGRFDVSQMTFYSKH